MGPWGRTLFSCYVLWGSDKALSEKPEFIVDDVCCNPSDSAMAVNHTPTVDKPHIYFHIFPALTFLLTEILSILFLLPSFFFS